MIRYRIFLCRHVISCHTLLLLPIHPILIPILIITSYLNLWTRVGWTHILLPTQKPPRYLYSFSKVLGIYLGYYTGYVLTFASFVFILSMVAGSIDKSMDEYGTEGRLKGRDIEQLGKAETSIDLRGDLDEHGKSQSSTETPEACARGLICKQRSLKPPPKPLESSSEWTVKHVFLEDDQKCMVKHTAFENHTNLIHSFFFITLKSHLNVSISPDRLEFKKTISSLMFTWRPTSDRIPC